MGGVGGELPLGTAMEGMGRRWRVTEGPASDGRTEFKKKKKGSSVSDRNRRILKADEWKGNGRNKKK